MSAHEHEDEATTRERDEGARIADRDRALVRLDEREIKERLLAAFDRFVSLGFAVHLIGLKVRSATEYTLALYPDGVESILSETLQEAADEFRLDYTIERGDSMDGWTIVLHPRW